jgi:hypothetical protein
MRRWQGDHKGRPYHTPRERKHHLLPTQLLRPKPRQLPQKQGHPKRYWPWAMRQAEQVEQMEQVEQVEQVGQATQVRQQSLHQKRVKN